MESHAGPSTGASPQSYLDTVIDIIRTQALFADNVDWRDVSAQARTESAQAATIADTYPMIREVLVALGDRHSFLMTPDDASAWVARSADVDQEAATITHRDGVGFVEVAAFSSNNMEACARFAERIQEHIALVDAHASAGWIVDLRRNRGGNMWPMLAGLGTLLGPGVHGFFVGKGGERTPWGYRNGAAFLGSDAIQSVDIPRTIARGRSTAVLIGPSTGSSGEAIAVAFAGDQHVRFFGSHTAGVTTANHSIPLADGAVLFLTVSVYADRHGRRYVQGIAPDVACEDGETVAAAETWIKLVR